MKELTRRDRERLEREEAIISVAEELFCKNGFAKVSMDELAKESEFTKKTIYRYFTCKEDLLFAVALRGYKKLYEMIQNKYAEGKTGLEKVRLSYYAFYEFSEKHPQLLQLINGRNGIKSELIDIDMPYYKKFTDFDSSLFKELIQVFLEGKEDCSIRTDIDASQLALSSIFVATGFFQMLSFSGNTYTEHFGLDKDTFVRLTIEMLVDSLRSK